MLKLVELNYHCHTEYDTPEQVIAKHALSSGFIHYIRHRVQLVLVKHLNYEGEAVSENIRYRFFKSRNKFWYIPFATHRFLKKEKPDVILVQGFVFVLRLLFLRKAVGRDCAIIVQHHGEKPFTGIKGFFQRKADASIDGYLFTSSGNAGVWLQKKVISSNKKCFEVLSASSNFIKKDKTACKSKLNISGNHNFLWVARLNANKDPITIIKAFEQYLTINNGAKLYMVYQTNELLATIKLLLEESEALKRHVYLIGAIAHPLLEDWFNACDFYISGSHSEGSGYALVEAMACGCIPVVTAIPSFKKITQDGKYGILFEPGSVTDLCKKLISTSEINSETYSNMIYGYSVNNLSYKTVADQIYQLAVLLSAK